MGRARLPCASKLWALATGSQAGAAGSTSTYILEAEELVAAIGANGAGILQQLLERRQLWGVRVLLRWRRGRSWTGGALQRNQHQPLCHGAHMQERASLTFPALRRPKNEVMAGASGERRVQSAEVEAAAPSVSLYARSWGRCRCSDGRSDGEGPKRRRELFTTMEKDGGRLAAERSAEGCVVRGQDIPSDRMAVRAAARRTPGGGCTRTASLRLVCNGTSFGPRHQARALRASRQVQCSPLQPYTVHSTQHTVHSTRHPIYCRPRPSSRPSSTPSPPQDAEERPEREAKKATTHAPLHAAMWRGHTNGPFAASGPDPHSTGARCQHASTASATRLRCS